MLYSAWTSHDCTKLRLFFWPCNKVGRCEVANCLRRGSRELRGESAVRGGASSSLWLTWNNDVTHLHADNCRYSDSAEVC